MPNQKLTDFIKQQIEQGVTSSNIKAILRVNGWQPEDIDQAFNEVEANSSTKQQIENKFSSSNSDKNNNLRRPKIVRVIATFGFLSSLFSFGLGVAFLMVKDFIIETVNNFTQMPPEEIEGMIGDIEEAEEAFNQLILFIDEIGTSLNQLITFFAGAFIIIGLVGIILFIGLWMYKSWGRWGTVIFSLLGIIISTLYFIISGFDLAWLFPLLLNIAISGYLIFNSKVKKAFTR